MKIPEFQIPEIGLLRIDPEMSGSPKLPREAIDAFLVGTDLRTAITCGLMAGETFSRLREAGAGPRETAVMMAYQGVRLGALLGAGRVMDWGLRRGSEVVDDFFNRFR